MCCTAKLRLVPFVFQRFVLKIFRNNLHAHFRARKMLACLALRFYCLGMAQDCERWVAECMECRWRKSVRDHRAGGSLSIVPRAFQQHNFMCMNLVGPFTKSPSITTNLLTMHYHFSRFPAAITLRDASTPELDRYFYTDWILEYGLPLAILHNRGTE
jgi:hypothetical protein